MDNGFCGVDGEELTVKDWQSISMFSKSETPKEITKQEIDQFVSQRDKNMIYEEMWEPYRIYQ